MGLFGGKKIDERTQRLIELQNVLISNNKHNKLVVPEEQLIKTFKIEVTTHTKKVEESVKILRETVNAEVFFSRLDFLFSELEYLQKFEPFTGNDIASKELCKKEQEEQNAINNFIVRYLKATNEKADSLKTKPAKLRCYQKFYDTLLPYFDRINDKALAYIEVSYKKYYSIYSTNQ